MTSRRETNPQADDAPLQIVGHRLHKIENVERGSSPQSADAQMHALPRSSSAPNEARDAIQRRSSELRQVVLVDREIDALRDLAIALRGEYDFHITISGNEALNLLRTGAIDTIVVGQTLYSSTGINVLAEARRYAPNTRRVLLANAVEATGISDSSALVAPFRLLQRPCTLDKLREILEASPTDEVTQDIPQIKAGKPAATIESKLAIPPAQPVPKLTPTARTHDDTHDPEDFEHVVLESLPEPPRRKSRNSSEQLNSLPVIVYTDNAEFYRVISLALQDRHNVRLCTQLERAAEFAEMGQCPLLITDRAATQVELQRISIALRALDAGIIVIAAGPPEVGTVLRKFLGTGALHSFVTKPINVPLVRLAVESGKRQYLQTKALKSAEPELKTASAKSPMVARPRKTAPYFIPSDFNNYAVDDYDEAPWRRIAPKLAVAAVAIIIAVGGGWYWWQQRSSHSAAIANDASTRNLARNIEYAQRAYTDGRYALPNNDSALFYYNEALKLAPQDATATRGIEQTIDRIIEQAEKALLDEKLDVATDAIATVRTLQPQNNRLPFLESQLNKERRILATRENTRNNSTTSASNSNAAISSTNVTDLAGKPISSDAQRRELVNRLIASARQRIAQERLLQPENDSAEFYLRQAEHLDPENAAVRQSLRDVGNRLLVSAKDAINAQQFEQARKRANDAARFGADAASIERLIHDIDATTSANSRGNYLRLALQRIRDNRLFEPERDSAKYFLNQLQRLDPSAAETQQATTAFALKLIENVDQAIAQNQSNVAAQLLNEVRRLGFNGPELARAEASLRSARNPTANPTTQSTAADAPKVVKTAPPKFPEDAARAGVQGWVDVGFRITASGDVIDVAAVASSSSGVYTGQFERAALAAIRQYKYEARNINDSQTTQRMVVRVQFKLN